MTVTVFSKPSCVQCDATYRALGKAGVTYATVDIQVEEAARTFVVALGHLQAPVVLVHEGDWFDFKLTAETENNHWSGFRPDKLRELPALLTASA